MIHNCIQDWDVPLTGEEKLKIKKLWNSSDSVNLPMRALFNVTCKECGSDNVRLYGDTEFREGTGGGCESCGHGSDNGGAEFLLALKCMKCGNAKVIWIQHGDING